VPTYFSPFNAAALPFGAGFFLDFPLFLEAFLGLALGLLFAFLGVFRFAFFWVFFGFALGRLFTFLGGFRFALF